MLKNIIKSCLLASIGLIFSFANGNFKAQQLKSSRVKAAYQKNWTVLQILLKSKAIAPDNFDLYLRSFKHEKSLEIWAKTSGEKQFRLIKTLSICATSGTLGPKRRQGDGQVPEGFYNVASLQPYSNYHLALRVNYPNQSDKLKATAKDVGGDIMIHGNCVTIGCIPLQDEPVEELYVLCVEAMNRNRTIHADLYPCKFTEKNKVLLSAKDVEANSEFWDILKKGYDYFELNHSLPKISTDKKGNYIVN